MAETMIKAQIIDAGGRYEKQTTIVGYGFRFSAVDIKCSTFSTSAARVKFNDQRHLGESLLD
jgi:hypothetical protein